MKYIQLEKSIIVRGLENLKDNMIDLLLLGLHNSGNLSSGTPNSLMVCRDGTFVITNYDEYIKKLISEGHIIDFYFDKESFINKAKELITNSTETLDDEDDE